MISQITILAVVFFRGADVTLFISQRVLIKSDSFTKDGPKYVRVGARMAYANSGAAGYNAVISREVVTFNFVSGEVFQQEWQSFETFDVVDEKLKSIEKNPANPLPVNAGSAESHDTYFVPFRIRCSQEDAKCDEWHNYLLWDEFLKKIQNSTKIEFLFTGEFLGEYSEEASCFVSINKNLIDRLRNDGWYASSCWESK